MEPGPKVEAMRGFWQTTIFCAAGTCALSASLGGPRGLGIALAVWAMLCVLFGLFCLSETGRQTFARIEREDLGKK